MHMIIGFVLALGVVVAQGHPSSSAENSALIRQQAEEDYRRHQDVIGGQGAKPESLANKNGYSSDGSFGVSFDNHDEAHRDRGYGYEKMYAYSRETAFFDFVDDKGALNARDIVEKYGKSGDSKDEDLFANISH